MITRIVKMTFKEEEIDNFLALFETHKKLIRNSSGCIGLKLLQNKNVKNIIFTHSLWENEMCLNQYRNSDLFQDIWPKTKALFTEPPQAWSLKEIDDVKIL